MSSTEVQNVGNIIHIPTGIVLDNEKGLGEYLWEDMHKYSDNITHIDSETGKQETYKEFLERVVSLAQALKSKGIKPNDVVAYCCANNMDYVAIILASIFIGAKFSALDNMPDTTEMAHCIHLVNPKVIFCDETMEECMESAVGLAGEICDIVAFVESDKFITMAEFIDTFKSQEEFALYKSAKLKDTCGILFTSGTSGSVKGAEITGYGLYYGGLAAHRSVPDISTSMICTLASWISNISAVMLTLIKGYTRIIYKSFNKDTFMKTLHDYKVNMTFLTQSTMNILMKFPECCNYDTSHIKYLMFGGSMIGDKTLTEINKLFPNAALINCYGMTEVGGLLFVCPRDKLYFDSQRRITVGWPNPGFKYKIVDISSEECLGPNIQGELRLKFAGIMNGYINNPEKSAEAFDEDGYFRTGDIVYYDDNYLFYVVDRMKEIFKCGGKHVSPSIIEDQLMQHAAIKEVAIVPISDEKGEIPVACIVLREGVTAKEDDFVKFIEERLSSMYHLRGGVKFVDSIPRTLRGKLRRNILKDQILKEMLK